jgi:hypothetical protein
MVGLASLTLVPAFTSKQASAQHLGANLEGTFLIRVDGAKRGDAIVGTSIGGDVNGDGRPDLIVGSPLADTGGHKSNGGAWVIFTPAKPAVIDLAHLGRRGFRIQGRGPRFRRGARGDLELVRKDCAAGGFSGAGDVNGDGRPDVIVGDPCFSLGRGSDGRADGAAYVVFGKSSSATVDLRRLGKRGFRINAHGKGVPRYAVRGVDGVGDMNGDRRSDVIVGATPRYDSLEDTFHGFGGAFVVFGKRSPRGIDLAHLGRHGFRIRGTGPGAKAGSSIAATGDMNGDGVPDVGVGAPGAGSAGTAYVVFGRRATSTVDLARLGQGGYSIVGAAAGQLIGSSIASTGDVNGDGRPDLALGVTGTKYVSPPVAGSAYVVFGKAPADPLDLAALGAGGFRIDGPPDNLGIPVAPAGDANGDGLADVVVSAPTEKRSPAFVVFGKASPDPVDLAVVDTGVGGFRIEASVGLGGNIGDLSHDGRSELILNDSRAGNHGREGSGSVYVVPSP